MLHVPTRPQILVQIFNFSLKKLIVAKLNYALSLTHYHYVDNLFFGGVCDFNTDLNVCVEIDTYSTGQILTQQDMWIFGGPFYKIYWHISQHLEGFDSQELVCMFRLAFSRAANWPTHAGEDDNKKPEGGFNLGSCQA